MNGQRGDDHRQFVRRFAQRDFEGALDSISVALQATRARSAGERLAVGVMLLERGSTLHMLGRLDEARSEFQRAEKMLDDLTFNAQMATFFFDVAKDPAKGAAFRDQALTAVNALERARNLDDGEAYYRRKMLSLS